MQVIRVMLVVRGDSAMGNLELILPTLYNGVECTFGRVLHASTVSKNGPFTNR